MLCCWDFEDIFDISWLGFTFYFIISRSFHIIFWWKITLDGTRLRWNTTKKSLWHPSLPKKLNNWKKHAHCPIRSCIQRLHYFKPIGILQGMTVILCGLWACAPFATWLLLIYDISVSYRYQKGYQYGILISYRYRHMAEGSNRYQYNLIQWKFSTIANTDTGSVLVYYTNTLPILILTQAYECRYRYRYRVMSLINTITAFLVSWYRYQ